MCWTSGRTAGEEEALPNLKNKTRIRTLGLALFAIMSIVVKAHYIGGLH